MVENGFDKEEQEILEAPHAAAAKVIANRIPAEKLKNWGMIRSYMLCISFSGQRLTSALNSKEL